MICFLRSSLTGKQRVLSLSEATNTWDRDWEGNVEVASQFKNPGQGWRWQCFLGFFKTHLEDLQDSGLVFSLSFQGVYKGIDGGWGHGFNRWGGWEGRVGYGWTDGLRARVLIFLHWEVLCSRSLQWKHLPSRMHLALLMGVSLERLMVSTSMALGPEVIWGDEWEEKGSLPSFKARMCIFCMLTCTKPVWCMDHEFLY